MSVDRILSVFFLKAQSTLAGKTLFFWSSLKLSLLKCTRVYLSIIYAFSNESEKFAAAVQLDFSHAFEILRSRGGEVRLLLPWRA